MSITLYFPLIPPFMVLLDKDGLLKQVSLVLDILTFSFYFKTS